MHVCKNATFLIYVHVQLIVFKCVGVTKFTLVNHNSSGCSKFNVISIIIMVKVAIFAEMAATFIMVNKISRYIHTYIQQLTQINRMGHYLI